MYLLYSLVTAAGLAIISPYFLARCLLSSRYRAYALQRLGSRLPSGPSGGFQGRTLWIHAVSVGEVLAAVPLGRELRTRYPESRLVISTTTETGQFLARERMPFADAIFYFPLDWTGPVRRVLHVIRPAAVIIVETEIWPNFLRECRRLNVSTIFVNGRLSEGSSRGFHRAISWSSGMLGSFLKRILNDATLFLMQSERDAKRLLDLGADPGRVVVTGNLKYDLDDVRETPLSEWLTAELSRSERKPVVVAGSVTANEEMPVLQAFSKVQQKFPNAFLILAPRKPDRFDVAAQMIRSSGRTLARRSQLSLNGTGHAALAESESILLLDSVGELASLYCLADAVFVGGSLVPSGGHNVLEPAIAGKVPTYGPFMENFRDMAGTFLAANAAVQVKDSAELATAWIGLLEDKDRAARMGAAARRLVTQNRGATERVLSVIHRVVFKTEAGT